MLPVSDAILNQCHLKGELTRPASFQHEDSYDQEAIMPLESSYSQGLLNLYYDVMPFISSLLPLDFSM